MQLFEGIKTLGEDVWVAVIDNAPEQAAGAPLFGRDGHFAGVLLPARNSQSRALLTFDFLRYFRERSPSMDDNDQNHVIELSQNLNIDLGLSDGIAVQKPTKARVETAAEGPAQIAEMMVDFEDAPQSPAYPQTAFFLQQKGTGGVLFSHGKADFQLKTELVNLEVQPGVTVTTTNEGVVVCGGRGGAASKMWIWTVAGIRELDHMPEGHSFHCSHSVFETVYVISGESTSAVSGFNLTLETWQSLSPLPVQRSHASASSYQSEIYLAGGFGPTNALSDDILRYKTDVNSWDLLKTKLERPTASVGLKAIDAERILVFGGQCANGEKSKAFYMRNLQGNRSENTGAMPETALFDGYGPTDERDFLVFSKERRLFMFVEAKFEFVLVALPQPEYEDIV